MWKPVLNLDVQAVQDDASKKIDSRVGASVILAKFYSRVGASVIFDDLEVPKRSKNRS